MGFIYKDYAQIITASDLVNDRGQTVPKGTVAVLVDKLTDDVFIAEMAIPAPELAGGHRYETFLIMASQIERELQ